MNHRIAILSDIHGDTTALEAVIADARALGVKEYWLLGDILLPGLEERTFLSCWMRFPLQ
ncbi:Ser/Thr protein phosphatase [Streptococcus australis]|uniref:Ser/Thr protein phosphatase n=1 Tax=Streptococcus viridans TaxID=78535 RepID=A0A447Z475_9STRE|nr:Ser/Thr protein phosphatase [Streptococcus viridans]VEE19919.1 Ser/Thr protein phosphatase [Streptococcus australis]